MDNNTLIITPETKIYDLLQHYPQLEDSLIEITPVFKKLKNPVLRKTIAKVTNLKQASAVGNVSLDKVINLLRNKVGQDKMEVKTDGNNLSDTPEWFDETKIKERLDARSIINSGGHPLDKVIKDVRQITEGMIYELITPFLPVPLIDKVEALGFVSWTVQADSDLFKTYFIKSN